MYKTDSPDSSASISGYTEQYTIKMLRELIAKQQAQIDALTPVLSVEQQVSEKVLARAERGRRKYGVSMDDASLSRATWLAHAQEEALDMAVYLEKLISLEDSHAGNV